MKFRNLEITKMTESESEERGPVTFIASTDTPDRYDDVVGQNWSLEAFERNPVILFNHNPQKMPIGKGRAYVEDGRLMIDVEFDENDEDARKIEDKVRRGFISAVSVGFQPLEAVLRSTLPEGHKYRGSNGYYFSKNELLEVSVVTIPANNEATLTAKNYRSSLSLSDVARSLTIERHVISVEQLDNGNFVVTYAGDMPEPPVEESYHDDEEDNDKMVDEESDKMVDEEEEDKAVHDKEDEESKALDVLLAQLKTLNKR